jgi:hypothetical protein
MRSLPQIVALYEEIDRGFDVDSEAALTAGDHAEAQRIEQKQLVNDQAYFVLCRGHLEAEIDDACRAAIARRKGHQNWEMRRGFDFYDQTDRRLSGLPFERRVAIVLDRNGGTGSPWAMVISYYGMRNRVAHGNLAAARIDVSRVVQDFYVIQGTLTR